MGSPLPRASIGVAFRTMRGAWTWGILAAVLGCGATQVGTTATRGATTAPAAKGGSADSPLERLIGRPAWLFPYAACPADVFPAVERPVTYLGDACAPDLGGCLERCRSEEANACYAAALRLQELHAPADDSEALFLRACRLGVASGCTNRAAGMIVEVPDASDRWQCANRTFEAMCEREDPWACTMWGGSLLRGRGTKRDVARAREILPKGCRLGEDDPACVSAREALREAEQPPE